MEYEIYKASSRGKTQVGWLTSYHSFSFGRYYNPDRMEFGLLRVLNDDEIAPGMGFGEHPHDNMEIISIPLQGKLQHEDNIGNKEIISRDEIQIMSAGSGIEHSEFNASSTETGAFLQVWISPHTENIEPRYEKKSFNREEAKNKFQLLISPDKRNDSLQIFQNAWISRIDLDEGVEATYTAFDSSNGIFVFVIEGELIINDETLYPRDALAAKGISVLQCKAGKKAEVLVFEVPMRVS